MHPPPSQMAHQSISLYQTITNTLGRSSTRSGSSSSSSSSMRPTSPKTPDSSHKRMGSFSSATSSNLPKPSALPRNLVFDFVRADEIRAAHALEVEGYPREDAASYEKLLGRQKAAPHLFLGAFVPLPPPKVAGPLSVSSASATRRKLVAFICATAAPALTVKAMSTHDTSEDAHLVCIHSVCVSPDYQRKGLATRMLENYIARLKKAEEGKGPEGAKGKRGYETLALLAHEELTPLYNKVGFRIQCHSHVQYGSGQWLEMRRPLSAPLSALVKSDPFLTRTPSNASSGDGVTSPISMSSAGSEAPSAVEASDSSQSLKAPASSATIVPPKDSGSVTPAAKASADSKADTPTTSQAPPGMPSQASILAALSAQSQPGKSPGVSYTSILGQAVAGKTAAEDVGMALEARLVDRETGTNLAKLYCPMENCRCCILGRSAGEWTRKESGPLINPALELPNSPSPPQGPAFPVHVGANASHRLLTSVKGFWLVDGPLQFDNVGFSRDIKWTAPCPAEATSPTPERDAFVVSGPRSKTQERKAKAREKKEEKERKKEAKLKEKRERKKASSGSDASEDEDVSSLLAHLSLGLSPGQEVTVKYLLCPDCECGPLGFTILPSDLQDGRLAAQVGEEVSRQKGGLHEGDAPPPQRRQQLFYLAAERVRYQFERN